MLLSGVKITQALRKVQAVRTHMGRYGVAPMTPKLSVEDLHWAIGDMYGLTITKLEVAFEGEYLRGKVERYKNKSARILVRSGQSERELRVVATKELCHLMIDEDEDWSTDGVEIIRGLKREWLLEQQGASAEQTVPPDPLQSEYLAQLAALELLYPQEFRDGDMAKLDAKQTTIAQIALEHDVPAYVIEHAMDHQELCAKHWALINLAA